MFPPRILLQAAETRVTEFTWLNPLSPWFLFLVVIPAIVAFATWFYRRERISVRGEASRPYRVEPSGGPGPDRAPALGGGAPPDGVPGSAAAERARWTLVALRVLVLLSLVAIIAEPTLRTTVYENVDSTVLVLVDDSLSMDIADRYADRQKVDLIASFFRSTPETIEATTRYDLVRRLFRDPEIRFIDRLRQKGRAVVYTFSGWLQRQKEVAKVRGGEPPFDWNEPEVLRSQESSRAEERVQQTRIADCLLDAVAGEVGARGGGASGRLAAVLLLTDGQQTPGTRPIEEVGRKLGQRGIPVHAIAVGNPDEPKDIRLVSLDVNEIVLMGDQVPFDVGLVADGFEGERVRVELKLDGATVATEFALLEGGGKRQAVRLLHRPRRQGDFLATVEVEYRPGELFRENNVISRSVKVLDQKIRVLYADGPPRWEYRYLKNALIRDPTMDAQVYLFSADRDFTQESSPGVPPLSGFPETREELFGYHVVVLGDVDIGKDLTVQQVGYLKDFVYEAGGGLVLVSGREANPAKYLHSELYALVPVELPDTSNGAFELDAAPVTEPFNVELTPVGREHEVLRLDNDPSVNVELWEDRDGRPFAHLPGFYWYADVGRAKKSAVVLARHPTRLHPMDQKGIPIFAFTNYGKGRCFFSGVDSTWRWRAGVDNQYFYRFWGQVIRFCATGRLLGKTPRYGISTDKAQYNLGETVRVDARVFDANMKPSTERSWTAYHQVRGLEGSPVEKLELELDPVQGQGSYRGGLVAGRVGLHDLWIGTETERLAFKTFEVAVPALERRDPRRNDALLREIARLSGGAFHELHEAGTAIEAIEGESRSQQGDVVSDPLWDEWWVLAAFACIIALEWILRKWANLL